MDSPAKKIISTDSIRVELSFRIGYVTLTVGELSNLMHDDILSTDRDVGDGVDICIGDRVIATGTLIRNGPDNRLGVRITGSVDNP